MIEQQEGKFKRRIVFKPGFCWLRANPHRNYGVSSVRMWFILIGEKGAVQWCIGTDWFPEAARTHLSKFPAEDMDDLRKPRGWDLGYHAKAPQYEGQSPQDKCDCFDGPCYYDGSSLAADNLIEGFLNGGDEWVWNRLEAYYASRFEGAEYPNFLPIIVPHPDDRPASPQ